MLSLVSAMDAFSYHPLISIAHFLVAWRMFPDLPDVSLSACPLLEMPLLHFPTLEERYRVATLSYLKLAQAKEAPQKAWKGVEKYLLEARSMMHLSPGCAGRWEVWEGLQVRGPGKR